MPISKLDLPQDLYLRTITLLEELTRISSASEEASGLFAIAERLTQLLRERGLSASVHRQRCSDGTELPVVCAGVGAASDGASPVAGALLAIGHLDTVLTAVPPRRDGDRLVATGAVDMKAGLVAFCGALDLLAHRGLQPPAHLRLVAAPDEEVGGELSRALARDHGAVASELWVLEPGNPAAAGETMVAGRRGLFNWELEVTGISAHAGLAYWEGRSALAAAVRWCMAAEGLAQRGAGPTVNASRLVGGDASFVDALAEHAELLGSDRQLNVVPDRARAEGEARFLRKEEGRELRTRLTELAAEVAAETGTEVRFRAGSIVPPLDPDGTQVARCARAVELAAARGWHLGLERERGGISFPNFLTEPGRIPILDGLGPVGGGMHTRGEYVDLVSLGRRMVLLADLLAEAAATAP
jgi:glutamate carboxypeptidase